MKSKMFPFVLFLNSTNFQLNMMSTFKMKGGHRCFPLFLIQEFLKNLVYFTQFQK